MGWAWVGACSQPGLEPPSVLVLVFLLVFLNLVVLRRCKAFLEWGGRGQGEQGRRAQVWVV